MKGEKVVPVEKWLINPTKRFINNSSTSGILLFSCALIAFILSNSPFAETYHHIWEIPLTINFNGFTLDKTLHHWINDGLMAVFFFVVGLELKREIIAGELRDPKKALLPLAAALGGMVFPAAIYIALNSKGIVNDGWGIPMATDIAFALGILYLLGDKVPVSLKIFLTALAIADDLGAVLVIAFFYTSDINFISLFTGAIFMSVLIFSNMIGVRNTIFYGIIGIGGLWLAFLMSGVHATIAAVLAAFTIPADVKMSEAVCTKKLRDLLEKFKALKPNNVSTITDDQLHVLEEIREVSKKAMTPLQRLEHRMHPLVAFVVMPIFALSNAGVTITGNLTEHLFSTVTIGVFSGLIIGKVVGVTGIVWLLLKMKWATLPDGLNKLHIVGAGFLAAIGFTMSLFITDLAFKNEDLVVQAKLGILAASLFASVMGFIIVKKACSLSEEKC